jgi:hypothetical protein
MPELAVRFARTAAWPLLGLLLAACGAKSPAPAPVSNGSAEPQVFFDDFSYPDTAAFARNGWIARSGTGHPGLPGATWSPAGVSFQDDPAQPGNRVLRMTSETDGTGAGARQVQICYQRKYLEGTYAARVHFRDSAVSGPDGDQLVQSFYTISPRRSPENPEYSELDFEYHHNGGWGASTPSMFMTSWNTHKVEPGTARNASGRTRGSLEGWHTLLIQVANGEVDYLIDGEPYAHHGGQEYPIVPMSINFNQWFIEDGVLDSREPRQYGEEIDWVFHQANAVLSTKEVEQRVADFRQRKLPFVDSVPPHSPPLPSPCDI